MTLKDEFLASIEAFLVKHQMGAATFGKRALNDPNFVFDLRQRGRSPSLDVVERVKAFMAGYRKVA